MNRGRKIYSMLSSRNMEVINVHNLDSDFEDESVKLVPKVLEAVHIYAGCSSSRGTCVLFQLCMKYCEAGK